LTSMLSNCYVKIEVFTCPKCSKQFYSASEFSHHKHIHILPILYRCCGCRKRFLTPLTLKFHKSFHCFAWEYFRLWGSSKR